MMGEYIFLWRTFSLKSFQKTTGIIVLFLLTISSIFISVALGLYISLSVKMAILLGQKKSLDFGL